MEGRKEKRIKTFLDIAPGVMLVLIAGYTDIQVRRLANDLKAYSKVLSKEDTEGQKTLKLFQDVRSESKENFDKIGDDLEEILNDLKKLNQYEGPPRTNR